MTIRLRHKNTHNESDFDRLVAQESLILETTEEICRILESEKITRSELARQLGKSKGFVTQVLSGDRNMTLNTAADFAFALGHRFSVRAVPICEPSVDPSVSADSRGLTQFRFDAAEVAPRAAVTDEMWSWLSHGRAASVEPVGMRVDADAWPSATLPPECEDDESDAVRADHEFTLAA